MPRLSSMTAATDVILFSPDEDPLMRKIALAIEGSGLSVRIVDLDPTEADDALHEARCRRAFADMPPTPILGGFSLGARIAARLSPEIAPRGLLCFAYPFHVSKDPSRRHGLDALSRVRCPTCIIQGTRDNHGTEAEVRGYRLPASLELVWLRDGNHRFRPRERSGLTQGDHVTAASAAAISFIRSRTDSGLV